MQRHACSRDDRLLHVCAGKIVRLRQKLLSVADSVKGFFGSKKQQDTAAERLERLQVQLWLCVVFTCSNP